MATFISHSPAETENLGETWGSAAATGLVIGLSGDLGTGKTQLVKGLARGLGFTGRVSSPTFALVNIYEGGRLLLFHLDLYRLDTPEQIISAGLEEYLQPRGVTVIEWAERWFGPESRTESPKSKVQSPKSATPSLKSQVSSLKFQALTARRGTGSQGPPAGCKVFQVHLETISETERRISYEDPGA
jgi:tRNA threonylcarbamoyladenosine biosynthesis protein TsaE